MIGNKPTTLQIRTDNSIKEQFVQVIEQLDVKTQGEALEKLIKIYETNKLKGTLNDRAKEIEAIKTYLGAIEDIYLGALSINVAAEERIKKELAQELNSKDETILELQRIRKELKKKLENSKEIEKQNKELIKELDNLREQNNTLNQIVIQYKEYKETNIQLENGIRNANDELINKNNIIKELENKLHVANNNVIEIKEIYHINLVNIKEEYNNNLLAAKAEIKEIKADYKLELKEIKEENKQELVNKEDKINTLIQKNNILNIDNNKLKVDNDILKKELEALKIKIETLEKKKTTTRTKAVNKVKE